MTFHGKLTIHLCCNSFQAVSIFLAFLQTYFSVMHVKVVFRGKLIRNQLFPFKVSNISSTALYVAHKHTFATLHACRAVWALSSLHQLNVGVVSAFKPSGFEYEYINHFMEY